MYYFFSLLLTFLFVLLTVAAETGTGRKHPRAFFVTNLAFSAAGAVLLALSLLLARNGIFGSGYDAEFTGWAWDMLVVYYQLSLIPCTVFFAAALLSCLIAVFDRKQRAGFPLKLRLSVTVVFSVVMLLLAPMYSFMTVNGKVALEVYVLLTGFGEALLLRAPLLIEYGVRMMETEKTPKA